MTRASDASDPFDLARFTSAQAHDYDVALNELRAGAKRSHWMWYVFPQFAGLGRSSLSQHYAIGSRAEAQAYLAHPLLGPRLRECAAALLAHRGRSAGEIMGSPDDLKLRSSATLFAAVSDEPVFRALLDQFFSGQPDPETLRLIQDSERSA